MQNAEQELLSQLRKSLTDRVQELKGLLPILLARQLMVKGSVYPLRRKCGKPTCHCADGTPHESMVLSWSEEGRTRLRSISGRSVDRLKRLTERYGRFRKARARLVQISKEILEIANRIEEVRRREP
ncbi:MAG: hypothetical protein KAJ42_08610 [Gemmatimonadetes bacterium]|nr:hypothetical protein [Gemmatimonadota bacterium]